VKFPKFAIIEDETPLIFYDGNSDGVIYYKLNWDAWACAGPVMFACLAFAFVIPVLILFRQLRKRFRRWRSN